MVGGAGCALFSSDDAEAESGADRVTSGDVSNVLNSTLQVGGCTATKVGPRHLLLAARCVGDELSPGKAIALNSSGALAADAPKKVTIADVKVHASYAAKCVDKACDFTRAAASDSPDIAVLILKADLTALPTVPVDLDPVGETDSLLLVTGDCATVDGKEEGSQKAVKTKAAAPRTVNHLGSEYQSTPELVGQLGASYVVTAAGGLKTGAPRLCRTDIGAPLVRAGTAAVAGVTSNYTTFPEQRVPATLEHTRVDTKSRFKIGEWLTSLGVETTHSCGDKKKCTSIADDRDSDAIDAGPMVDAQPDAETTADAGLEPSVDAGDGGDLDDGGSVTPEDDRKPRTEVLPPDDDNDNDNGYSSSDDSDDADAGTPKKAKAKSGCSAAPTAPSMPSGGSLVGLGLAFGAVVARRRRASRP